MNLRISADTTTLYWRLNGEILKIEPWGPDGVRVRATNLPDFPDIPGALDVAPAAAPAMVSIAEDRGSLTNGRLRAEI
jgi:alpha-D-xyloside xylohydrolase